MTALALACGGPAPGQGGPEPLSPATGAPTGPGADPGPGGASPLPSTGGTQTSDGGAGATHCATSPDRTLLVEDVAPVVRAVTDDGTGVVYTRHDGTYPTVVAHVPSGTKTAVPGELVGFSPDGRHALVHDPNHLYPVGRLVDVEVATGAVTSLLDAELRDLVVTPDRRHALLLGTSGVWSLDVAARQLAVVSPHGHPAEDVDVAGGGRFALLFRAGAALHVDASTRAVTTVSSSASTARLLPDGRVLYVEGSTLHGWAAGAAPVVLGDGYAPPGGQPGRWPLTGVSVAASGAVLVRDPTGAVRLWAPNGAANALPGLYTWAEVSPDGNRLALERPTSIDLFVRDAATGVEQRVAAGPDLRGTFSDDGRFLVFFQRVPGTAFDEVRVRLFDAAMGAEVPLGAAAPTARELAAASFHRGGAVLQVFLWDQRVLLFNTATGARLHEVTRSVVPAEGEYTWWGPGDDVLYMPAGGYGGAPADLWAWASPLLPETLVAAKAKARCFSGRSLVVSAGVTDPFGDGPAAVVVWDPASRTAWQASPGAEAPGCVASARAVLLREGVTAVDAQRQAGTLVHADPGTRARRVVGDHVTGWAAAGGRLVYSDLSSVCSVRLDAPP